MSLYNVDSSLCPAGEGGGSSFTASYFVPSRGPPSKVMVDINNGDLVAKYPGYTHISYTHEGTRYNNSQCSFCPYSSSPPELLKTEYLLSGGIRLLPTPMYGPCFDGMASTKMNCVQVSSPTLPSCIPTLIFIYLFSSKNILWGGGDLYKHTKIESLFVSARFLWRIFFPRSETDAGNKPPLFCTQLDRWTFNRSHYKCARHIKHPCETTH